MYKFTKRFVAKEASNKYKISTSPKCKRRIRKRIRRNEDTDYMRDLDRVVK